MIELWKTTSRPSRFSLYVKIDDMLKKWPDLAPAR